MMRLVYKEEPWGMKFYFLTQVVITRVSALCLSYKFILCSFLYLFYSRIKLCNKSRNKIFHFKVSYVKADSYMYPRKAKQKQLADLEKSNHLLKFS